MFLVLRSYTPRHSRVGRAAAVLAVVAALGGWAVVAGVALFGVVLAVIH